MSSTTNNSDGEQVAPLPELFVRAEMVKLRATNRAGTPYCDMCGTAPGTQRHHIITKSHTMGNDIARWYANHPWITAFVCQDCHDQIDRVSHRNQLLQKLYVINGRGNASVGYLIMKALYESASEAMRNGISWQLPDVKETHL